MDLYRNKPVTVEAIQWTGENEKECFEFCNALLHDEPEHKIFSIMTLEGRMRVTLNDYIIKGINGEFYPCKPDIFLKTYEPEPRTQQ